MLFEQIGEATEVSLFLLQSLFLFSPFLARQVRFALFFICLSAFSYLAQLLLTFLPCFLRIKKKRDYYLKVFTAAIKSMFIRFRLCILFLFIVLAQAKHGGNYVRSQRIHPASRKSYESVNNKHSDIQFQSVTRLTGSQPVRDAPRYVKTQW